MASRMAALFSQGKSGERAGNRARQTWRNQTRPRQRRLHLEEDGHAQKLVIFPVKLTFLSLWVCWWIRV